MSRGFKAAVGAGEHLGVVLLRREGEDGTTRVCGDPEGQSIGFLPNPGHQSLVAHNTSTTFGIFPTPSHVHTQISLWHTLSAFFQSTSIPSSIILILLTFILTNLFPCFFPPSELIARNHQVLFTFLGAQAPTSRPHRHQECEIRSGCFCWCDLLAFLSLFWEKLVLIHRSQPLSFFIHSFVH